MCCERIVREIKDKAQSAEDAVDNVALVQLQATLIKVCPDYLRTHPRRILYPTNTRPEDVFDAVVGMNGSWLDLSIAYGILPEGSETAKIAQILAKSQEGEKSAIPSIYRKKTETGTPDKARASTSPSQTPQ